jgi:hypothetical protein
VLVNSPPFLPFYVSFLRPQQKRIVEDAEQRFNLFFDVLNYDIRSPPFLEQLHDLTKNITPSAAIYLFTSTIVLHFSNRSI